MSRARVTRRRGSATALTGAVGNTPLTKHSSLQCNVADPGEHPLVEQCLGDGPVRGNDQVGGCTLRVPIVGQQIRS